MRKASIVVDKNLNAGLKANVASIILGQLSRDVPSLYEEVVTDNSGTRHAGIAVNVVVLEGSNGQILTAIDGAARADNVSCVAFTSIGQSLSNSYDEYRKKISAIDTKDTSVVGVGLVGDDSVIKPLTKKFSLVK